MRCSKPSLGQEELRAISSDDVNEYLREIVGYDVNAKDFCTWAGTVLMARHPNEAGVAESERQAKKTLRAAVLQVAAALGNTPQVLHPSIGDWRLSEMAIQT
jgi:DNA topoisomerase-1